MNMQMKRIEDLSSFVREIDSECTTLNMNHKYIIAGSKELITATLFAPILLRA